MTPADIRLLADHIAIALHDMGCRNKDAIAEIAQGFAPVAYRSLAEAMRCGEAAPVEAEDAQQVLVWQQEEASCS